MRERLRSDLLHILQHSLGLDEHGRGRSYRNHFVADAPGGDYALCRELVEMGLMAQHGPSEIFGGNDSYCFVVIDRGREVVAEQSPPPPRLSRSKQRYRRWLDADSSLSFGEWLRRPAMHALPDEGERSEG
jgi:hypothetical protein